MTTIKKAVEKAKLKRNTLAQNTIHDTKSLQKEI